MTARVRIKFCGFTMVEDVRAACELGVDAIGINLARGPRQVDLELARRLAAACTPFVNAVAVFADRDEEGILAAMAATRCQVAQLHGNEPPELAERLRRRFPVIKALVVRRAADLEVARGYPADAFLLDGGAGGTGQIWDHALASGVDLGAPIIAAGGLTPATVATAIARLRPAGVDTASGIESAPGRKDRAAMAAFVAACRRD
jgi:phosphoribosylanthranilate isomerase